MEEKTRDLHRSSTCSTLSSLRSQARYHSSSYKFKLYSFGVLDNNMMPKLAYFGHSLQGPLSTSKPKPIIDVLQGTIGYVSPEIFSCGIYTDKCDVYSFGNVLLDVIFGRKDKDLLVKKVNMFASLHFGKSTIEFREHLPLRGFWLWVRELLCNRIPMEELVDSDLNGKISPECWDAVTSIAQRCIEYEADERPTMGEVELLLERAFSLQQQADDITNTNAAHYTLSSTTYIHGRPSICIDANNTEDILSHQFSRADLALMTGNFNETKIIGKGSFGELYQGRVRLKGLTDNYYYLIAIKKMHWPSICYSEMQFKFREEIEKICVLRHPNLVSLLGFCNDDGDAVAAAAADDDDYNDDDAKILVSEFIQNGSLLYNLHESHRNKKALTWKKRLQICIGVTQGLHYLHTASIFHRNIKLTNILLDRAMVPKLSDFGFPWSNPIHAGCYAAPEWSEGHDFTDKCDVYSFGIVLLQVVFTSKLPLIEGESDPILKGKIAPQCWEVFLDITRRCLKFGPNERPTINEVMTQLEHALALQEEADANTSDEYNLLSMTFDDDALLGRRLC